MTSTAGESEHPATSAADGAMQLLSKFESLQRSIEEKRSGIEGCRRQQDDLRDRIQNAREERTGMEQTIARAEEETEQLNQQVKDGLEKDALEEDRRVQVLQKETEALRNLEVSKQYVQEQRQAENKSSMEFRVACKRLCAAALAAGEPMTPSYGLLSLHAMERDDLGEDRWRGVRKSMPSDSRLGTGLCRSCFRSRKCRKPLKNAQGAVKTRRNS